MIRMILAIAIVLCLSCTQATAPGRLVNMTEGGGGSDCIYEGGMNEFAISIHWDERNGWVIPTMVDNANFWGDSAIAILSGIKHAESTMTCPPAVDMEVETAYTDSLTVPPHTGGFGDQFTILIIFGGDYTPTSTERDSVVHLCNNAIWNIERIQRDVYGRWTSHWYGQGAFDYYYSGGF